MEISGVSNDWVEDDVLIVGAISAMSVCCGILLTWDLLAQSGSFLPLWSGGIGAMPAPALLELPCPGARRRWHERKTLNCREKPKASIHLGAHRVASWWNKLNVHTTGSSSATTQGYLSSQILALFARVSLLGIFWPQEIGEYNWWEVTVCEMPSFMRLNLKFTGAAATNLPDFSTITTFSHKAHKVGTKKNNVLINGVVQLFNQTWHGGLYLHIYSTEKTLCQSPRHKCHQKRKFEIPILCMRDRTKGSKTGEGSNK